MVNCLRDSPDTPFVNVNLITWEACHNEYVRKFKSVKKLNLMVKTSSVMSGSALRTETTALAASMLAAGWERYKIHTWTIERYLSLCSPFQLLNSTPIGGSYALYRYKSYWQWFHKLWWQWLNKLWWHWHHSWRWSPEHLLLPAGPRLTHRCYKSLLCDHDLEEQLYPIGHYSIELILRTILAPNTKFKSL